MRPSTEQWYEILKKVEAERGAIIVACFRPQKIGETFTDYLGVSLPDGHGIRLNGRADESDYRGCYADIFAASRDGQKPKIPESLKDKYSYAANLCEMRSNVGERARITRDE